MAKVVGIQSVNAKGDEQLAQVFEEYARLAREGELSDVMIIAKIRGADNVETDWDTSSRLTLLGALEMAKANLLADLAADGEDDGDEDEDDED